MEILKKIAVLIFFTASFLWLCKVFLLTSYPDFTSFYYGPLHVLQGQNPYVKDSHYFTPLVYPPIVMILFVPLVLFPYMLAGHVWLAMSLLCLLTSLFLCSKINNIQFFSNVNMFFCGLVFLSFPVKFTLGMGQINLLILLLVMLAIYYMQKKKKVVSGIFIGMSLMIKFFPLLLLILLALDKKWKVFFTTVIVCLALLFISIYVLHIDVVIHYFTQILPNLLSSWKGDYYNQSLSGFLTREMPNVLFRSIVRIIISLVLVCLTIVLFLKTNKKDKIFYLLKIAVVLTLSVLLNSFSWQHHFVFLIPAYYFVFFYILKKVRNKRNYMIMLLISYILVGINFSHPSDIPTLIQSHVFYGAFLLYVETLYILYRYA